MTAYEQGVWDMCEAIEQRMAESSVEHTMSTMTPEPCRHQRWHGDDMTERGPRIGCRIATVNSAKKLLSNMEHLEEVIQIMKEESIDIQIVTEPGRACQMTAAAIKNNLIKRDMAAEIVFRGTSRTAGGQVMIIGRKWSKLQRTVHRFRPVHADKDRVMAVEFNNRKQGDHNKMLVIGYYGYNDAPSFRLEIKEVHEFIWRTMKAFRRMNPFGSVVIMGDFNAAEWTETDTDEEFGSGEGVPSEGEATGWEQQRDAFVIEHMHKMKMVDALRERYPMNNFVTRRVTHQGNRLLDRAFVSRELTVAMRAAVYQPGIFTYGGVDTDHKMVVVDLAIDSAGGASEGVTLWRKHKKETLRWDADDLGEVAQEKIKKFNCEASNKAEKMEIQGAEDIHRWLLDSADGNILKRVLQEFPKKARGPKNFQSDDWKVRTNLKRIRESIRAMEERIMQGRKADQQKACNPLKKIKEVESGPQLRGLYEECCGKTRAGTLRTLRAKEQQASEYLAKEARSSRQESIAANKKRRTTRFQHALKKKLKMVITSIMRRATVHEEITSCVDQENDGIHTDVEMVAKGVISFYRNWMKSKVHWSQRWESWQHLMELDTKGLVDKNDEEFINMAYRGSYEKYSRLQSEMGIWDGVWERITTDTVRRSLAGMKSGTAGGPSGLTYDVLKALDDENMGYIRDQMQQYMDERSLPRVLNRSLLRPLPKTDAGLADLALTRPIALMEVLGKLFEKILFDRILKVILKHDMLDGSQHGGMPGRSTAAPMHNLAEVMQDAQISGKELHVLSADLTKAFDTLEHWSQVMSWRALGMPQEMAEMLMRMDQQGETSVIMGQGRTTADVLGEEGWFKSERGVRQGSIGGPLKWIVYMNFWLTFMHNKHHGQGYRMSFATTEEGELTGQMFIDDSNWFANSADAMQDMIESNETFVHFHGLSFNKKKCEYIVMNQKDAGGVWMRPNWCTGEILVETIRTVRDKGKWETRWAAQEERLRSVREKMHHMRMKTAIAGGDPMAQITKLDHVHDLQRQWESNRMERWWKQDSPPALADDKLQRRVEDRTKELLQDIYGVPEEVAKEEAVAKVSEWVTEVQLSSQMAINPGRAVRYLGVWYEEGFKWKEQRRLLAKKFSDLNESISMSTPTREEAVYCINATINAALKYPLRVANISNTALREWDTANRKVASRAGALPALAPMVYHLPKDMGGMGLESLEQAVEKGQLEAYIEALNSVGLNGEITRAGRRRYQSTSTTPNPERKSIHAINESVLLKHGWCIMESEEKKVRIMQETLKRNYMDMEAQGRVDSRRAQNNKNIGREWEAYGDGATYEATNRAGWGLSMRSTGKQVEETERDNGRLAGTQSNDGAEAAAILAAMLMVHPEEGLTFYCDNQGCIQKWERLGKESTMRWGYRAIWNRIQSLKGLRESTGCPMGMRWVHSHVDDETRRKHGNKKCACRERGELECNPTHRHHMGTETADAEAKEGAFLDANDDIKEVARGEHKFVLHNGTQMAQGAYGKWITDQLIRAKFEEAVMDEGEPEDSRDETRLSRWARAERLSDKKLRRAVIRQLHQNGGTSWRFWIRAGLQELPTMSQMAKYANAGGETGVYMRVYGDHIGAQGCCTACGCPKETTAHALWECNEATQHWEAADLEIWHKWDKLGLDWGRFDWKVPRNRSEGWQHLWGVIGMVPEGVLARVAEKIGYITAFSLIKETAARHLKTARAIWEARTKKHLEWESSIPKLADEKTKAKKTVWSRSDKPTRKKREGSKMGPETLEQSRTRKGMEEKKKVREEARRATQQREVDRNELRRKARVPLASAWAIVRKADEEAAAAVRVVTKRLRGERQDRETMKAHVPLSQMKCRWTNIRDAPPAKILNAKPQRGQTGWWVPEVGLEVMAFWAEKGGNESLGGTSGKWHEGLTTETRWEEGGLPEVQILYECGHREWHCTSGAGTLVRLRVDQGKDSGGKRMVTDTMEEDIARILGPGTMLSVRWPRENMAYAWWEGKVVANEGGRIAVRYDEQHGYEKMVVWHDDLHARGTRLRKITRMTEWANETFQLDSQRITPECVLLTDDGQCECAWCYTKGWPAQIEQLVREGMDNEDAWELEKLGPREGRKSLKIKNKKNDLLRPIEIEEHENGPNGGGKPTARDLRQQRRDSLRYRGTYGRSDKNQEIPSEDRDRTPIDSDSRMACDRSQRRESDAGQRGGTGVDVPPGEESGGDEAESTPRRQPGEEGGASGAAGVRGSKRRSDGLGGGERGAHKGWRASGAQERTESADEDGEEQDMDQAGGGIDERDDSGTVTGWTSGPRSRPPRNGLDVGSGAVDDREEMEQRNGRGDPMQSGGADTTDEGGNSTQGWPAHVGHGAGSGRGMGVDRHSCRRSRMCDDRSGQSRDLVPGQTTWSHQVQGADGFCCENRAKRTPENSQEVGNATEFGDGGMAVPRVHAPLESKQYEHVEGVRPRSVRRIREEPGSSYPRENRRRAEDVCGVQTRDRGADESPGGGADSLRAGEPVGELFLGAGLGEAQDGEDAWMEAARSRPVRVRQTRSETHQDTDECGMEAERPDRQRQVQGGEMLRNVGKHPRSCGVEKAQAADSHKRGRKADESRGTSKGKEGGLLDGSGEEQGCANAGARNTDGSESAEKQKEGTGAAGESKNKGNRGKERDQEERPQSKRRKLGGGRNEQNRIGGRKRIVNSGVGEDRTEEQNEEQEEPSRKRIRNEHVLERKGEG